MVMDNEIQAALTELNNNIDNFIKGNEREINEIKMKMAKPGLPLSKKLDDDTYRRSDFSNYVRNGSDILLKKSLTDKAEEKGGYLIPSEIASRIGDKMAILSPIRSIAKVITISTNSVDILVDSKNPEAGWITSDEIEETASPEIRKIKIPVHEIYAKPMANQRLLDDSEINVEEWLINKISEKMASLENNAFVNGDGSNKPLGFLKYDSEISEARSFGKLQHFCTGADGKIIENTAVDLLIDMVYSLKPIYIKNAKWVMPRSALSIVRKLKNTDGANLWQPSLSEATPPTLLGYPVIIDDDMPAVKVGEISTSMAFGDFYSGYQIIDRQGLRILRDPYTSKPFVEFYVSKRIGGAVVDFDAIKLLKFQDNE
jgi:HK97 family phage major capsid protein